MIRGMSYSFSDINEKPSVILDIGAAFTKVGFAGESHPRAIIRSSVKCMKSGEIQTLSSSKNEDDLYILLVEFLHQIYYRHLLVNPKDRRVVIVESILSPTIFRESLAKVLFCHYEAISITFLPSHLAALFPLVIATGLVIDIGFSEALCIPVYNGTTILKAWQSYACGANRIHGNLRQLLAEKAKIVSPELNENESQKLFESLISNGEILEDLTVRACFVTSKERSEQIRRDNAKIKPVAPINNYTIGKDTILNIEGEVREKACEVLFEPDIDGNNLALAIVDAVLKSPIDTRKSLASNIILIGGTAMLPGIKKRLLAELKAIANSTKFCTNVGTVEFKIHPLPVKENCMAWLGGSIFAASECPESRSLALTANSPLTDWCDFENNNVLSSLMERYSFVFNAC